ncbi:MAG TPA: hypothetical protein VMI31_06935 [Fimbriimonadaceae bacterium]|nr:hypothetical protein [Fimbriimonadaceae bacterium]
MTTPLGTGHFDGFCKSYDRSYGRTMNESTYHQFVERGKAWPGAYLFGDFWRMNDLQIGLARKLWEKLAAMGAGFRLFNDPHRQLGRYEFLKAMNRDGVNAFDVYRLDELGSQVLYPVFVRREHDHAGPQTDLLRSERELKSALDRLILDGDDPRDLLVVEYVETVCHDGAYRKYGVMRIGDVIFPHHIMAAKEWHTKASVRIRTEEAIAESDRFTLENPHAELVMPVFERAGIEFGRIDYALSEGKIQVWEINDNPVFMHMGARPQSHLMRHVAIKAAFDRLSEGILPAGPISFEIGSNEVWEVCAG